MGYIRKHSAGTYRLFNHVTKQIILSRDVTFLGNEIEKEEITPNPKLAHYDKRIQDSDGDNGPGLIRRKEIDPDSSNEENEYGHELQSEMLMDYNRSMAEEQIIQEIEPVTIYIQSKSCARYE